MTENVPPPHANANGNKSSPETKIANGQEAPLRIENGSIILPNDDERPKPKVRFRPLQKNDKDVIHSLHETWFPVKYKDEFYDALVLNKVVGTGEPLYSSVAVLLDDDYRDRHGERNLTESLDSFSSPHFESIVDHHFETDSTLQHDHTAQGDLELGISSEAEIVGCVVGSFVKSARCPIGVRHMLVHQTRQYTLMFYIMTLGTSEEFRKKRLGTALVRSCLKVAENEAKCGVIYLHVITYNIAAIRFYENLDFVRVTELQDYYTIDGDPHNCYLYAKYINGNNVRWSFFSFLKEAMTSVWSTLADSLYSAFRLESE